MRGRRAEPVLLKIRRGNPGKRRLPAEPEFGAGLGPAPEFLGAIAAAEWKRLAGELENAVDVRGVDRNALAGYCAVYQRWREAEAWIRENGTTAVLRSDKGAVTKLMLAPEVSVAFQALRELRALMAEFGFSPASRSKVPPKPAAAAPDNVWAALRG
jgi:P27 family predicted phage terminase small subunit